MSAAPPPAADVRLFLTPAGPRGFERAARVDVGVMRFGGLVIQPVPAPAYTEDAYLVRATVELDLEPGFAGARWAEAGFEFGPAEVAVLSAVPERVRAAEPPCTYRIDSTLQFVPAPDDRAEGPTVHLGPQDPVTDAFGIGSPHLRWRWTAPDGEGIGAGTRTGWFVLLVAPGMTGISLRQAARYELSPEDTDGLQAHSEPVEHVVTLPAPVTRGTRGVAKLEVVRRMGDSWRDLADVLDIPGYDRARFTAGDEPRGVWHWLADRDRLADLPGALRTIGRADLADLLDG